MNDYFFEYVLKSLEWIAAICGIVSVYFSSKQNILVYPIGIISTLLYIFIFYEHTIYGEMVIQVYYTLVSFYGWFEWHQNQKDSKIQILHLDSKSILKVVLVGILSFAFVSSIYMGILPFDIFKARPFSMFMFFDIVSATIFFIAMYLMAKRFIEHWYFWIIGNLMLVPMMFYRDLIPTAMQYIVFLILAMHGLYLWKIQIKSELK